MTLVLIGISAFFWRVEVSKIEVMWALGGTDLELGMAEEQKVVDKLCMPRSFRNR